MIVVGAAIGGLVGAVVSVLCSQLAIHIGSTYNGWGDIAAWVILLAPLVVMSVAAVLLWREVV